MEKQKRKLECLQSVQKNLHESPSNSELRRKLMDQSVMDAAYGCFMRTTNPFYDPSPLRYPHKLTRSLPEGISHKELGIINLTAQFMAVYGIFFQRSLIKTVIMDPRFEFMTKPPDDSKHSVYYGLLGGFIPTDDSKFSFYCRLFRGYMAISKPCQELTKNAGASPETVLDGFFDLLAQLEKQEDEGGVEKIGMVDLHVFEFLAKTLDQIMPFPPGHLSNILEPLKSKMRELLMTPSHDQPDDSHDKMRDLVTEMHDVSSRHSWRSSVSYHACYQQMQILSQNYSICEHPKDLQNNSDQGPADLGPPPKFTSLIPEGITRKELGIIKLTAQFEAVYGWYFRDDIEKRVIVDPRFEFLGYSFFSQLSLGYRRVLIPSRKKPSLETVLEGFWNFVEMVEEGVDMRMIDLHAFEFFANMENQELKLPFQYIVMMMYPLVPPFAHLQVRIPHGQFPLPPPRPEHPNPKRLKVDKYSTRPGNHVLCQHMSLLPMEKQKTKLEYLQSVQKKLHESPSDSELRSKLMDQYVMDAAHGCFMRTTNPFYDPFPLRYPHNFTRSLPEGITRKEVGIINLTAQFMAVYGIFFQRALIKTVIMDPRFEFMTKPPDDSKHSIYYGLLGGFIPTDDSKFSFYCRLFRGYMAISKPCQELTKNAGASPETVLDGFFDLLAQLEKQEDEGGVEKISMVDLHVFEFLAKTLGQRMPFPPGHFSNMLQPWRSKMIELLMTPIHDRPDDSDDKMRDLAIEMHYVSSRRSWRSLVSYHACCQQMQILSRDYSICEHPKDLQNNSDQGPADLGPPPKFTSLIPEGITRKELGIIKLTAQFEAVYGRYFRDDIEKKVIVDPRFEFLKPTHSRYSFFSQLSLGYDRVLIPSLKKGEAIIPVRNMSGSPPSMETVLEGFWNFVEMVEGVDMRMIDLHAFEFFANMEDQELNLPPQYIVMMMYPLVPPFAHLQVRIPHGQFPLPPPRPEHPNPKRLKVDKYSTRPGNHVSN